MKSLLENIKKLELTFKVGICFEVGVIFLMLCLLIALRNTFPLSFPTLYAEDGTWTSKILFNGFIDTALNARNEFPVVGLVSLQWVAIKLNHLLFLNDISQIPIAIYIVSTVFLSGLFTYVYCIFKDEIGGLGALLLVLLLVLLPTGSHGDEIFGRIGNLVWYSIIFAALALYSLLFSSSHSKIKLFANIFIVFILALTFPLVLGQILIAIIFLKYGHQKFENIKTILVSLSTILIVGILVVLSGNFMSKGGAENLLISYESMVEFILARAILFPLIASFYGSLNNLVVILICSFVISFLIYLYKRQTSAAIKIKFLYLTASFIFCVSATVLSRAGLSSLFNNYGSTYPDRYFIGLNSLFIILLLYITLTTLKDNLRRICLILFALIGFSWIVNFNIFERSQPAIGARELGTLRDSICDVAALKYLDIQNGKNKVVPIYPVMYGLPWRFDIPDDLFTSASILQCVGRK